MSDLNDDLLNYELGEDIEDQAILVGDEDEDELLLSDEENEEQKALLKNEAEKWVNSALTIVKPQKSIGDNDDAATCKKVEDIVTTSSSLVACENQSATENLDKVAVTVAATESDVTTSEELPIKQIVPEKAHVEDELSLSNTKNDEVTSTNKEIEEQAVSQTPIEEKVQGDGKNEELSSQEFVYGMEHDQDDEPLSDPREDLDEERGERTNIKLSAERDDQMEASPERYQSGRYPSKRGRGGMAMRGGPHFPGYRPLVRYPHINYPQYPHHPNENINPQIVGAGSAGGGSGQYPHPYGPMDPQMTPRQPAPFPSSLPPRMDYHHRPLGPNFRPQNPNEFNVYRGPRPDYNMNGAQYNNFGPIMMRPMYRPPDGSNMPPMPPHMRPRMPMQRPPNMPPGQGNFMPQQHPSMPPGGPQQHPGSMNPVGPGGSSAAANLHSSSSHPSQSSGQQSVLPRKVLINPNFKGGVEAATNQLMKDTQFIQAITTHVSHLQSDEELLRQQEEFITQNRMHIQKRRYERSPERKRSRERSYSPSPLRRAIERRSPSRERRGRNRRGGAPEMHPLSISRFRKEKDKIEEEEDEETRAYRMKIEKQKAMREKILRDKEMRRRKAAEGKLNEDKPQPPEEPPSKLTPIIVTESKIISLKKKNAAAEQQQMQQQQQLQHQSASLNPKPIQRTIPTAKILPESVKKIMEHTDKGTSSSGTNVLAFPIKKSSQMEQPQLIKNKSLVADDEFMLEEELLADTPSPPPSPLPTTLMIAEPDLTNREEFVSERRPRRRVILKQQPIEKSMMWNPRHYQQSPPPASEKSSVPNEQMKKGIFDRLDNPLTRNSHPFI